MKRVAVVGAGWAGLAAAVRATQAGHEVHVFEMARRPGGRARSVDIGSQTLDNGQHILVGAYVRTLDLMRAVGIDPATVLARLPLALVTPDGSGLRLPRGRATTAFVRGVLGHSAWSPIDRLRLLAVAAGWGLRGFRSWRGATVADLCRRLPPALVRDLVDPLCVAALNTPAPEADAGVFLRILKDALFGDPGGADLLLPRRPLGAVLPDAAWHWLQVHGAQVRIGTRVAAVEPLPSGWNVDGVRFDAVIVATSAVEAARLAAPVAPSWAARAAALRYEPIVTVTIDSPGTRLAHPMISLPAGPAQFVFDHGAIGGRAGRFAFVVSGARAWVEAGLPAVEAAVLEQARSQFPAGTWHPALEVVATWAERRATFRCTPGLDRPTGAIAGGLAAAGDYVAGPYPATLEGAVRSGEAAVAWAAAQGT